MGKIKDVLRLKFEGQQPHQLIADALGLSKGDVRQPVAGAHESEASATATP